VTTANEGESEYPVGDLDLAPLNRSLQHLYRARALIGSIPPGPGTARGRTGALLVGVVRRALFWFLPQLELFHAAMIEFAENQAALMEELRGHLIDIDDELLLIRQDLARGENRAAAADIVPDQGDKVWLQLVRCQARVEAVRQGMHSQEGQRAPERPV
jgi:hypothetical protein